MKNFRRSYCFAKLLLPLLAFLLYLDICKSKISCGGKHEEKAVLKDADFI